MMILNKKIKSIIKRHALKEKPKECCGLVFESNGLLEIQTCSNTSENPEKHFSISPRDYLKATRKGSIKAIYHSHLSSNDKFSPNDILHSKGHKIPFLLYCQGKDSFSTFDPEKNKTFIYDRVFKIGEIPTFLVGTSPSFLILLALKLIKTLLICLRVIKNKYKSTRRFLQRYYLS